MHGLYYRGTPENRIHTKISRKKKKTQIHARVCTIFTDLTNMRRHHLTLEQPSASSSPFVPPGEVLGIWGFSRILKNIEKFSHLHQGRCGMTTGTCVATPARFPHGCTPPGTPVVSEANNSGIQSVLNLDSSHYYGCVSSFGDLLILGILDLFRSISSGSTVSEQSYRSSRVNRGIVSRQPMCTAACASSTAPRYCSE